MSVTDTNEIPNEDDTSQISLWKKFSNDIDNSILHEDYAAVLAMVDLALANELLPGIRASFLCRKGAALNHMNKFSEAIPVIREALSCDPENYHIMIMLSQVLARDVFITNPVKNCPLKPAEKKKLSEALGYSLQAFSYCNDRLDPEIYRNIAVIHKALGQFSEALPFLKAYCELMARNIENPSLYYDAVLSYVATLSYEAKDEHLKEADRLLERSCIKAQADGLNDAANMMRQWRSELKKIPRFPSRYGEKPFELLMN